MHGNHEKFAQAFKNSQVLPQIVRTGMKVRLPLCTWALVLILTMHQYYI